MDNKNHSEKFFGKILQIIPAKLFQKLIYVRSFILKLSRHLSFLRLSVERSKNSDNFCLKFQSLTEDSSKGVFSGWLFIKTFDFIFLYVFQGAKDSKDLEKLFSDCQEKFHFPLLRRDCYPQQPKLREIQGLNIWPKSSQKFYYKIFICSPFLLSNSKQNSMVRKWRKRNPI